MYWGYIGIMEKMETTKMELYRDYGVHIGLLLG